MRKPSSALAPHGALGGGDLGSFRRFGWGGTDTAQPVEPIGISSSGATSKRGSAPRTFIPWPSSCRAAPLLSPLFDIPPISSRSSRQLEHMPQVVSSASPDWAQVSKASSTPHQAQTRRQTADCRESPAILSADRRFLDTDRGSGSSRRLGGVRDWLAIS